MVLDYESRRVELLSVEMERLWQEYIGRGHLRHSLEEMSTRNAGEEPRWLCSYSFIIKLLSCFHTPDPLYLRARAPIIYTHTHRHTHTFKF